MMATTATTTQWIHQLVAVMAMAVCMTTTTTTNNRSSVIPVCQAFPVSSRLSSHHHNKRQSLPGPPKSHFQLKVNIHAHQEEREQHEQGEYGLTKSSSSVSTTSTRRSFLLEQPIVSASSFLLAAAAAASPDVVSAASPAADELPLLLRDFTKLAPLGNSSAKQRVSSSSSSGSNNNDSSKSYNLPLEELRQRLAHDLTVGATDSNQGGYIISGDLSLDIFRDDCVFVDPTNRVKSLNQYKNALRILFDPQQSTIELLPLEQEQQHQLPTASKLESESPASFAEPCLKIDPVERTISGRFRSRGVLKLPWHPYVTAYESDILWRVGDQDGLIYEQEQHWSKSYQVALGESFTPSLFRPPPRLTMAADSQEPRAVTKLFQYVNGRRPYEYSADEKTEINLLIDQIARDAAAETSSSLSPKNENTIDRLAGTWMVVYLQPGPSGIGLDRRIPFFPDFAFNDNFQLFFSSATTDNSNNQQPASAAAAIEARGSVQNVGQLFGPFLDVSVFGSLEEEQGMTPSPRFKANITSGKLCAHLSHPSPVPDATATSGGGNDWCLDLPMIRGEGLFESVYLGQRLRIGQNLNGGGARVVQVRLKNGS